MEARAESRAASRVAGRQLRAREAIALDLIGVVGLVGLLLGLTWLRTSEKVGFDVGEAVAGVLGQLGTTLPAALLVLGATALELAAGLILARAARRTAFDSAGEALIAAMVAAVLKDTVLLGVLGGFGLFVAPILIAVNVLIVAAGLWLPAVGRHVRPLAAFGPWRETAGGTGSLPVAALVAIVWAGPVILQLASPVVPFIDVLPNYVGPVEHLRTFGWFSPLSATQSPIIGPSRTVLGYDALMGSIATMTNLPAALSISAFILPQTVLVAAGVHRLATALQGSVPTIGAWALLAFALSQPFARLADARGTVVVTPLVCLGLAVAAEALRKRRASDEAVSRVAADADPWRIGRGAVIGLATGSATLVHPVIGFFAVATVGLAGLLRPAALGVAAVVAAITAGLIALPQLATMIGLSLPTIALGLGLPAAITLGIGLGIQVERRPALRSAFEGLVRYGRYAVIVVLLAIPAVAVAVSPSIVDRLPDALGDALTLAIEASLILLVVLAVGAVLGSQGARSPLVWIGIAVGAVAVVVANALPAGLGFLGDALRFEVPKTVHYWLSTVAAVGAAAALAFIWTADRIPFLGRAGLLVAFVIAAALPIRPAPIDAYHLGEHRWSETFAIDLRFAGTGFWIGHPDHRTVIDEPRAELVAALRAEIEAGRLRHDTPVLHVAESFQQWVSAPLGVFAGVTETSVSLKPEVSHQTVGGRLYGFDRLPQFLASGTYPYLVLEPHDSLPAGLRDETLAAGYRPIFSNDRGEVFRLD